MKPVGVGIIGFGRIGAEHAGWIGRSGSAQVAAVVDQTPARRQMALDRGLVVHEDLESFLADLAVEAVVVSTPTAMHFEQARRAIEAGKHVLIEKPMAMNLAEARWLVQEASKLKRVLSVFQNRRWDIDYLTVKAAMESQVFGKVINVESRLGQWASCVGPAAREYNPNWRNEAALGGGGLFDWGSHFVDQMWRIFWPSKPLRVFAQLRGNVWTRDCDDFARLLIDFEGGAVGVVEINTTTTQPLPRWHIDGTNGSASGPFSLEFDLQVWSKIQFKSAAGELRMLDRPAGGLDEPEIWRRFAAAVRGEGLAAVSAASVLPTMALLDAARESSRRGVAVDVRDGVEWVY